MTSWFRIIMFYWCNIMRCVRTISAGNLWYCTSLFSLIEMNYFNLIFDPVVYTHTLKIAEVQWKLNKGEVIRNSINKQYTVNQWYGIFGIVKLKLYSFYHSYIMRFHHHDIVKNDIRRAMIQTINKTIKYTCVPQSTISTYHFNFSDSKNRNWWSHYIYPNPRA